MKLGGLEVVSGSESVHDKDIPRLIKASMSFNEALSAIIKAQPEEIFSDIKL